MTARFTNDFWHEHLNGVISPLVHFVPSRCLELEPLRKAGIELGFTLFVSDLKHISSMSGLAAALTGAMHMPGYVQGNWNAFLDLSRDLSWAKASGYVLAMLNADSLVSLPSGGLPKLLQVLEATVWEWRDERGEYAERTAPIPFHVVFSGSSPLQAALLKQLNEPLCEHQANESVCIIRTPGGVSDRESFNDAQRLIQNGAELELVMSFLRERGLGRTESVYAMAGLTDKSVPEAKALVDESQTWSDRYETDFRIREAAREALRDLGFC